MISIELDQLILLTVVYIFTFLLTIATILSISFLIKKHKVRLFKFDSNKNQNVYLIGGFSILVSCSFVLILLNFGYSSFLPKIEPNFLMFSLLTLTLSLIMGIIDDIYSIRVITKFIAQTIMFTPLAIGAGIYLFPSEQILSFMLTMAISITVVNSLNLMDGIDTMLGRIAFYTLSLTFVSSILVQNYTAIYSSIIFIGSLNAFYYFNKSNKLKIYLGELGVNIITVILVAISIKNFSMIHFQSKNLTYSIFLSFFPILVCCSEAGISFLRRIIAGKSPFIKDSFHVHHLIEKKYKMAQDSISFLLAIELFIATSAAIYLAIKFEINFIIASLATIALQIAFQYSIAGNYWIPQRIGISKFFRIFLKDNNKIEGNRKELKAIMKLKGAKLLPFNAKKISGYESNVEKVDRLKNIN